MKEGFALNKVSLMLRKILFKIFGGGGDRKVPSFLTLSCPFAIFEPKIWRRLMPFPACFLLYLMFIMLFERCNLNLAEFLSLISFSSAGKRLGPYQFRVHFNAKQVVSFYEPQNNVKVTEIRKTANTLVE